MRVVVKPAEVLLELGALVGGDVARQRIVDARGGVAQQSPPISSRTTPSCSGVGAICR